MKPRYFINILFVLAFFLSCNPANKRPVAFKFGIVSYLEPESQDSEKYFESNTLKSGKLTVEKNAADIPAILFSYRDSSYFGIDYDSEDLIRFAPQETTLKETGRLHLDKERVWRKTSSWFSWVAKDTLLIGSSMSGKHFEYCLISTRKMELLRKGHLDIPLPGKNLNYGGIYGRLQGDKLYIAYTIYDYWNPAKPAPSDTTYLATISYPEMKTESISKDARATFPGGYLLSWEFGLAYQNQVYFVTQTGGRTREHPWSPNAVFRIKNNQQQIDPSYFFKLADKKTEEAYGLYDLGEGLAITKIIRKVDIDETMDYLNKNVVEYYLTDLIKNKKTKLLLPKDILDFRRNILRIGNEIYIAIYDPARKCSVVWVIDKNTLKATKGLTIPGHAVQLFKH